MVASEQAAVPGSVFSEFNIAAVNEKLDWIFDSDGRGEIWTERARNMEGIASDIADYVVGLADITATYFFTLGGGAKVYRPDDDSDFTFYLLGGDGPADTQALVVGEGVYDPSLSFVIGDFHAGDFGIYLNDGGDYG